jgi:hypothetical protein
VSECQSVSQPVSQFGSTQVTFRKAQLHTFLTSAGGGVQWSAARPGRFYPT